MGICDGATYKVVTTDPSGAFVTSMVVRRIVNQAGATADCAAAPGICGVTAGSAGPIVVATLAFDPTVPVAGPTLDVRPASDLQDGEVVQVDGAGFTPGADIVIAECPVGKFSLAECDTSTRIAARSDSTGRFATSYSVHAVLIPSGSTGEPQPQLAIDCRSSPCRLTAANQLAASEEADAPIAFASSGAPPPELPSTGARPGGLTLVAGMLLVVGLGLVGASRSQVGGRRPRG